MDLFQAVVLGILQGITEWLPVSSSGHLALAQHFMELEVPVSFDILLHIGTLGAVLIYYRNKIFEIGRAVLRMDFQSEDGKLALFVLAGSVPTALIGFAFKDFFKSMFSDVFLVGVALILTGAVLFSTRFFSGNKGLGWMSCLTVGAAQGIAVAPGISRSGWTISAGMMFGIEREKVADYSFILSIPALIGAMIFEGGNIVFSGMEWTIVFAGVLSSLVAGYLSIAFLLKIIKKGHFYFFSYYCWIIGLLAVLAGIGFF
ncbi:undecaprenyl-diphosphate phosphatase [Candidatus Micrarchaeota archaeon]|nr:undecaprenyl-diphosphate phosphatase [Candidatus Micrarchaeota archaeon]